jgi:nitroreductase
LEFDSAPNQREAAVLPGREATRERPNPENSRSRWRPRRHDDCWRNGRETHDTAGSMLARRGLIAGGAGVLALGAIGYRAWDRGVFTGAAGPAYRPWDEWPGSDRDGNRRLLRAAILAASPHNTQPWRFATSTAGIDVYADRRRHLGAFDPFRREMHLGVGCAIENMVRAARSLGLAADVLPERGRLVPSPGVEPVLAARVALGTGRASGGPLVEAIRTRHTDRGPYRDQPIPAKRVREFVDLVSGPDLHVAIVGDREARQELGAVVVAATERIIADPEMSIDSFRWIRTGRREVSAHRDGVTLDTSGASRLMTIAGKMFPDLGPAATDRFWLEATRDVHVATAPIFGMIVVRDRLDMAQAIIAGRAWQRVHLTATAHGLAAQPLNQPIEMIDRHGMLGRSDEFRPALASFVPANGWEPTFVFRLGYPMRAAPRSPRRPLEDVLHG